jgi:hypothetical protein
MAPTHVAPHCCNRVVLVEHVVVSLVVHGSCKHTAKNIMNLLSKTCRNQKRLHILNTKSQKCFRIFCTVMQIIILGYSFICKLEELTELQHVSQEACFGLLIDLRPH